MTAACHNVMDPSDTDSLESVAALARQEKNIQKNKRARAAR